MNLKIWYGSRFVDNNTITQFYYGPIECMGEIFNTPSVNFFNMAPNDFTPSTHKYIVAVWRIKLKPSKSPFQLLKPSKPPIQLDMPPFITTFN